ncbi:class I SAM-dependent methyltransferase [Bradyrhizobium sp. 18BD]
MAKSIGVTSGLQGDRIWGGSTLHNTQRVREGLPGLLANLGVHTLLDLPCGDLHWLSKIDLPVSRYIGGDIVPELIERTRERHGRPDRTFIRIDICNDPLPQADLLLCRDCFIHLSEDMIFRAIDNIVRSEIKYLLTTTFPGGRNHAIGTGDFFTIDLRAHPYNFPAPLRALEHGVAPFDWRQLALWKVETLRDIRRDHLALRAVRYGSPRATPAGPARYSGGLRRLDADRGPLTSSKPSEHIEQFERR